jgi:hypothetical protein
VLSSYDSAQEVESTDAVALPSVPETAAKPELQTNGGPTDLVILVGKAMRVQHQPVVPKLTGLDTGNGILKVREWKRYVDGPEVIGCQFGGKVSIVRWAIAYLVDGYIKGIPEQHRPTDCCN